MNESALLELLYTALQSPLGIVVETSDPELCKAKLYTLRKQDPELACLSFLTSPVDPAGSFWIVKKETSDGQSGPDETYPEPASG